MTLGEARTRLGLPPAGTLEKAVARRAYLQAIKRCKPEVDPEGFQRIREAYELIEALLPAGAPVGARSPVVVTVEPPAGEGEPEAEDDDWDDEPPAPFAEHLHPYQERLTKMFGQPWPLRAQVGWEAYRAFPGDRQAREFLLGLLPAESLNDITIVLRDGIAAGDRGCLLRLLEYAPDA